MVISFRRGSLKRSRLLAAAVVASTLALAALPGSAGAYKHEWSCSREQYNHCTDATGKAYNPWHEMQSYDEKIANWCVSGTDKGGGIWNFGCAMNSVGVSGKECHAPEVQAYSYGGSYSGSQKQDDVADTTGGC